MTRGVFLAAAVALLIVLPAAASAQEPAQTTTTQQAPAEEPPPADDPSQFQYVEGEPAPTTEPRRKPAARTRRSRPSPRTTAPVTPTEAENDSASTESSDDTSAAREVKSNRKKKAKKRERGADRANDKPTEDGARTSQPRTALALPASVTAGSTSSGDPLPWVVAAVLLITALMAVGAYFRRRRA